MSEADASYRGQRPAQGRLVPLPPRPGEGYAVLACGGTEVVLSYTLLHHLRVMVDVNGALWEPVAAASTALDAITCEASLGRVPGKREEAERG